MKNKMEKTQEYSTKNTYTIEHMPLSDVVDISNFTNGSKLNIVKYSKNTVITGDYLKDVKPFGKQLIVDDETLKTILEMPYEFESVIGKMKNSNPIYWIHKDYWEFFKEQGVDSRLPDSFTNNNVFDEVADSDYMFVQFVENNNHLRVIKDSKGNLACEPTIFDYINARLDNERYDLDGLVEHLMKRDDVALVAYAEYSYKSKLLKCPIGDDNPDLAGIISNIPGYNASEGCDEYISMVYYPKSEDISKFMDWKMSEDDKKNQIYDVENFVVQEILGCKKFRNNPVVAQDEPEVPKRKFKRG